MSDEPTNGGGRGAWGGGAARDGKYSTKKYNVQSTEEFVAFRWYPVYLFFGTIGPFFHLSSHLQRLRGFSSEKTHKIVHFSPIFLFLFFSLTKTVGVLCSLGEQKPVLLIVQSIVLLIVYTVPAEREG